MILRIYSLLVLWWDLVCLCLGTWCAIVEAMYRFIRPPNEKSVLGEIALVVGAGRGIGKEIAIQLAELGAKVVCLDLDAKENMITVQEARRSGGGKVWGFTCDITRRDQVISTAELVKSEVGNVTLLIHCCGFLSSRTFVSQLHEEVHETLERSVMSHFLLLEVFLPGMVAMDRGHIVAITSLAGLSGIKDRIPLTVAQCAVQGLVEALSEEMRPKHNIHISLVHVYPFIVTSDHAQDIRVRIPSYFGTISPRRAAKHIISGVRKNYTEFSIPCYVFYAKNILRLLPRRVSSLLREVMDTGMDCS